MCVELAPGSPSESQWLSGCSILPVIGGLQVQSLSGAQKSFSGYGV